MDTNTIYNMLLAKGELTLKGALDELQVLRRRLIAKKHREQRAMEALGVRSDKKLNFELSEVDTEGYAKMTITLRSPAENLTTVTLCDD